jgi:hypothetical protein
MIRWLWTCAVLGGCGGNDAVHHLGDAPDLGCSAIAVDAVGSDVFAQGVDPIPDSGFTWTLWFNATALPTETGTNIRAGASLVTSANSQSCEDVYLGFGTEMSPANELAWNVDGNGQCGARDATPLHYTPATPLETGRWYFVAASHDYATGVSKLYVDGAMVAMKTSTVAVIAEKPEATIGRWTDRGGFDYNQFHGALDEVVLWKRPLTDTEVSAAFAAGGDTQTATDVTAGYHFDEGTGTSAADFSDGAHAATLEGGATWVQKCRALAN